MERTESEVVREFGAAIRSAADPAPEWTDARVAEFGYRLLDEAERQFGPWGAAPSQAWQKLSAERQKAFVAYAAECLVEIVREGR